MKEVRSRLNRDYRLQNIGSRLQQNLTKAVLSGAKVIERVLAWHAPATSPKLAMAISLAGASAEQLTGLTIAALIVVSAACWLLPRAVRQMATRS
jgi:hypothetical protein